MIDQDEIARVREVFWAYPAVLALCDEVERLNAVRMAAEGVVLNAGSGSTMAIKVLEQVLQETEGE